MNRVGQAADFLQGTTLGQGVQTVADAYQAVSDAANQIPTQSSISSAQNTIEQQSASAMTAIANANANATQQSGAVQAAAAQASAQMTTVIVVAALAIVAAVYFTRK